MNKHSLRLLFAAFLGLAVLAGCSLPRANRDGMIPQTGSEGQEDYPPMPTWTVGLFMPRSQEGQSDQASTPNSLTLSPPSFLGDPTTPAPEIDERATLPAVLATLTPEGSPATAVPSITPAPSSTGTARPSFTPRASRTPGSTTAPTRVETTAAPAAPVPSTQSVETQPAAAQPTAANPQMMARESLLGQVQLFSTLAESKIRNLEQGEIGEVRGMIFDSLSGRPLFAVVEPDGWRGWRPGARVHSVPVPWGALNLAGADFYQPQAGILLLPVVDHVLSTAPTIDESLWDGQNPPDGWNIGIADYWENFVPIVPVNGGDPKEAFTGSPLLMQEAMLDGRGIDVTDSEGETIGRVKDVVIDANGSARYAVVLVDDFLGLGGRLAPVPWDRLIWSPGGWFILQGPQALLKTAPGYPNRGVFPDFNEPDWDREIRGYWSRQ